MNTDDVDLSKIVLPGDGQFVRHLFDKQRELMEKYHLIEAANGARIPEKPYNLDDAVCQQRIKDFAWRATEELAESFEYEINFDNWRVRWDDDAVMRHWFEELADALHFLIEMTIYTGHSILRVNKAWNMARVSMQQFIDDGAPSQLEMRSRGGEFVFVLGLVGNCLKNKPWKQSQMPTDKDRFAQCMDGTWLRFWEMWRRNGCTLEDVYRLYMAKHQVNRFRQDSKY